MHKPNDEHMVNEIREKLENFQPAYNPESWQKMSAKLDQHVSVEKKRNFRTWFFGFGSGILFSVLVITFIFLQNQEKTTNTNQAYQQQIDSLQILVSKNRVSTDNEIVRVEYLPSVNRLDKGIANRGNDKFLAFSENVNVDLYYPQEVIADIDLTKYRNVLPVFAREKNLPNGWWNIDTIKRNESVPLLADMTEEIEKSVKNKKIKAFRWKGFKAGFKLHDEFYKDFTGPDKFRVYYSPEFMFGDFQNKTGISQGVGIMTEGPVSKRLSFGLGAEFRTYNWQKNIEYSSLKMSINEVVIEPATDSTEAVMRIDSTEIFSVDSLRINSGNWQYFEIPFEIRYKLMQNRKSSLYLNSSVSVLLFYKEDYESELKIGGQSNKTSESFAPFKNYHIPARIKLGLEYRYALNNRWSFSVEPYYRWNWNALGAQQLNPGAFGINAGVVYRFRLMK